MGCGPAIAKQAAVSASLQTIDAYARAASAAGGFDHGNSHLTRTQLTLDPRGWSDLSRACLRLLDQVDRIEEAANERIERNPHSCDTKDIALVMMLFEAARLAIEATRSPSAAAATAARSRHPSGTVSVSASSPSRISVERSSSTVSERRAPSRSVAVGRLRSIQQSRRGCRRACLATTCRSAAAPIR